jgi:histidinol phosphatase-like enzyme
VKKAIFLERDGILNEVVGMGAKNPIIPLTLDEFKLKTDAAPALRELNVADRSTLVAFNGKAERKRASFVTDPAAIRALFESAL